MWEENVELVRHCYDLVGRGDIAGLVDLIGPEFELHENVLAPPPSTAGLKVSESGLRPRKKRSYVTAFRLRQGKFVFAASHGDLPEALDAAGISE